MFFSSNLGFQWVDTAISLEGFCQKSALCTDESWREIERIYVVIGQRRLKGGKTYGFALYDLNPENGSFKPISLADAGQSLSNKLAKIGLPLKKDEQESVLMIGDFWPKFTGKYLNGSLLFLQENFIRD